jgi:hypothetical protein
VKDAGQIHWVRAERCWRERARGTHAVLITPHVAAGVAIAAYAPSAVPSLALAVASHFVLDTVPHWQEVLPPYTPTRLTLVRVPIDAALALTLVWWAVRRAPQRRGLMLATTFVSAAPDLDAIFFVRPSLVPHDTLIKQYFRWHIGIQRETRSLWGLATQGVVTLGCVALARRSQRTGC